MSKVTLTWTSMADTARGSSEGSWRSQESPVAWFQNWPSSVFSNMSGNCSGRNSSSIWRSSLLASVPWRTRCMFNQNVPLEQRFCLCISFKFEEVCLEKFCWNDVLASDKDEAWIKSTSSPFSTKWYQALVITCFPTLTECQLRPLKQCSQCLLSKVFASFDFWKDSLNFGFCSSQTDQLRS